MHRTGMLRAGGMVSVMDEVGLFECQWRAPTDVAIAHGQVHLWRSPLTVAEAQLEEMVQVLSPDERDRALRLSVREKQRQFIVGRSRLRTILGRYLGCEPQQVQFDYTDRGKPLLAAGHGPTRWKFNLAHSHDLALIAIAADACIGVDLEAIRPIRLEPLAKRFLLPDEVAWLLTLPSDQQGLAFFRLWVCKEAYLKATGEGLAGLRQIQVLWKAGEAVLHPAQAGVQAWSLRELNVADGFAAALVVEGCRPALRCFDAI